MLSTNSDYCCHEVSALWNSFWRQIVCTTQAAYVTINTLSRKSELCLLAIFPRSMCSLWHQTEKAMHVHFTFPAPDRLKHSRSSVVQLLLAGLFLAVAAKIRYCLANVHRAVELFDFLDSRRLPACAVSLLGETRWSPNISVQPDIIIIQWRIHECTQWQILFNRHLFLQLL